jgi:ribonuclease Z
VTASAAPLSGGHVPISFQVLGQPGRDNALFVKVDTGQRLTRLLFDCGDGCPHTLSFADVLATDHLFFSHLHMDHVGGFDAFFRANYNRDTRPNVVWGPPGTADILQHRFRGFLWNLVADAPPVSWSVCELHPAEIRTSRYELQEAFAIAHDMGSQPRGKAILDVAGFTVEAYAMDHGTPSIAYVVREPARVNVDTERMKALGFGPGPWVKRIRGPQADPAETVTINGTVHVVAALQAELLVTTPGESIAYLTDFRMDAAAQDTLGERLRGVGVAVCECQYRSADRELAVRNMHMAADEVAVMAAKAGVGRLVLFHLSDRYQPEGWGELLAEARANFANTSFPDGWVI